MPVSRLFVSISAFILYSSTVNTVAIAADVSKKGAVETLSIQAVRETVPVASTGDAADDPARDTALSSHDGAEERIARCHLV